MICGTDACTTYNRSYVNRTIIQFQATERNGEVEIEELGVGRSRRAKVPAKVQEEEVLAGTLTYGLQHSMFKLFVLFP